MSRPPAALKPIAFRVEIRNGQAAAGVELRGQLPKRQLPQMLEVFAREEIRQRGLDAPLRINLAFTEPFLKIFGGQIDIDHLVRFSQHRVWNTLPDLHADHLFHRVVQAFQVLHVHS